MTVDVRDPLDATRAWIERAVVGLGLCPFAKAPLVRGRVRLVLCAADDPRALIGRLEAEARALVDADPATVETTLIVAPNMLHDFDDFLDVQAAADATLADLGLDGTLQIASFHPAYRFDGTAPDALENATNRAPHPTLQLLREASVARAVATGPDAERIVATNLATLDALGAEGWAALRRGWTG